MSSTSDYTPPKVWTWKKTTEGRFANINRPIAGPTQDKELPVGRHPMQLYSLGTPNGQKVTIMLEELLALGHTGAEYDAWLIKIGDGEQFGSGFVAINPKFRSRRRPQRPQAHPRIRVRRHPALPGRVVREFLPGNPQRRMPVVLFWQMGSAPTWAAGYFMPTPRPR
jgi:GST-like protein